MTVKELIRQLKRMDPKAKVHVMIQRGWPFECELDGVVCREEYEESDGYDDEDEESSSQKNPGNDVFIVQGEQIRYGSDKAWDAC